MRWKQQLFGQIPFVTWLCWCCFFFSFYPFLFEFQTVLALVLVAAAVVVVLFRFVQPFGSQLLTNKIALC